MLRISEINKSEKQAILLLEGQVTSQTTDIVREIAEQALAQGLQLTLDLSGVMLADRAGIALLWDLQQQQVALINGSPFLKEQLKVTITV